MKNSFILFLFLLCSKIASSQIVICDTMPINYNPATIAFYAAPASFGDSVLTIDITNNSTTNFAYPLAKLIPLTALPVGTTLASQSQDWVVFGSSWNTGQTNTCPFFFNVTQAIPTDYTVTFELYASNFLPLTIDSCVFANALTVNLNPSLSLTSNQVAQKKDFTFSPNPAKHDLKIKFKMAGFKNEISLLDMNGKLIRVYDTSSDELIINLARIESGVYYLASKDHALIEKLVIIR